MKIACIAVVVCMTLAVTAATAAEGVTLTGANNQKFIMADGKLIPSNGVALFDYVNAPDSHYSWFDTGVRINNTKGWTGYLVNMTSQQWLTPEDASKSIWTHQLLIIKPDVIRARSHALVYVTGGGNDNPKNPSSNDADVLVTSLLAQQAGTMAAVLWQVPNQPCRFAEDATQRNRGEDSLVSYTWRHIVDHPDRPDWVVYLPMVKSVIRAMDTVTAFSARAGFAEVSKFCIAGASKRGATTWLVGAYDGSLPESKRRVAGIAPIVFDMLNLGKSVAHMYEAYGGWTFAFEDYWESNVTVLIGTPAMDILTAVVDPISYVDTLMLPKLVITATGDEFFMPDDNWYWWDDLKGEKHLLMVENAEHSMATGIPKLFQGASAFYQSLIFNYTRPHHDWTIDENGKLTLTTSTKPSKVSLHIAETVPSKPNRRDFRMVKGNTPTAPCEPPAVKINDHACFNPIVWVTKEVEPVSTAGGVYRYEYVTGAPASGNWLGYFFTMEHARPNNVTITTTTQVSIVPRVFPFPPCGSGESCRGNLV